MNNYFGIGLDAKISLDFSQYRDEHPEKCRSRARNLVFYGLLGGREIVAKTFRNLQQRVRLECDGQLITLPNLQGIVVLNIPRCFLLRLIDDFFYRASACNACRARCRFTNSVCISIQCGYFV